MSINITLLTTVSYASLDLKECKDPIRTYTKLLEAFSQGKLVNVINNNSTLYLVAPNKEVMCEVLNSAFINLKVTFSEPM